MRPLRMTTSNAAMPAYSKRAIPTDRFGGGITFPPTVVAEMDSHREASMERMRAVVLAAGMGKRMHSDLPKVLHPVCGQPLLVYVLDALAAAGIARPIIVIGHGADAVREGVANRAEFVEQREQLGTGHAVVQALPLVDGSSDPILELYGGTPPPD